MFKTVLLRIIQPPLSFLEGAWRIIFSPFGFTVALFFWWEAGFVVPDFRGMWSWMTSWMQGNWFPWAIGIAGGCYVVLRIARYWINRPLVRTIVETRIVYQEAPAQSVEQPKPEAALNERWVRTQEVIQTLVFLDDKERKVAEKRVKDKLVRDVEKLL